MQQQCIAHLVDGRDIMGMAQTGCGKTGANGMPLMKNI
ncbi:DEAD/DEAH box helicase, partial [Morganella morganii]